MKTKKSKQIRSATSAHDTMVVQKEIQEKLQRMEQKYEQRFKLVFEALHKGLQAVDRIK